MIVRKSKKHLILFLSFVLCGFPLIADTGDTAKLYPLPMAEIKEVLLDWFTSSSFQVRLSFPETGLVQIMAGKATEHWRISLIPHSPLATEVEAICSINDQPDTTRPEALWSYVSAYVKGALIESESIHRRIPAAVLSQNESVVCVKAKREDRDIQISGFLFNDNGLVMCTAHDLEDVKYIKVILHDGRIMKGRLVKKDLRRDLALIHVNLKPHSFVSFDQGRNLLGIGEKLYSVGCNADNKRTIYSGVIHGLPRRVNNLSLWQVIMEIHPGSSGSPVFDVQGNLVAMVMGRYRGTDSVGFLIPLETIIDFVRE